MHPQGPRRSRALSVMPLERRLQERRLDLGQQFVVQLARRIACSQPLLGPDANERLQALGRRWRSRRGAVCSRFRNVQRRQFGRQVLGKDDPVASDDQRVLDGIAQLANVAAPLAGGDRGPRFLGDAGAGPIAGR